MKLTLSSFKRQELASCLDAFKALAFHPGNDLIQVGLSLHPRTASHRGIFSCPAELARSHGEAGLGSDS